MNCHYITAQLQLIRDANAGASDKLSSVGSTGLDEQLHAVESAIARIRDRWGGGHWSSSALGRCDKAAGDRSDRKML